MKNEKKINENREDFEMAAKEFFFRCFYEEAAGKKDERKAIYEISSAHGLNRVQFSMFVSQLSRDPAWVVTEQKIHEGPYPSNMKAIK